MFADLLHLDRTQIENHSVVGLDGGDVAAHVDEVIGRDFGSDGVRVRVFGRATHTVRSQQEAALENEVIGVVGPCQSIKEGLKCVAYQVLLCRRGCPSFRAS